MSGVRRARTLMVQGTMSGVGKSLLVAGLCRVLAQDGLRVAPFKSQNMALNSAVTADGLEMGRAQAMQAAAAGIEPTVAMNPVLLKPTTNTGSQVIVRGRALGTMPAREYFGFRKTLRATVRESLEELAAAYDVVLIEGAGSPVELNLLADDIVNMGVARMARSPVLLVGDIDRGGVFAQLIGTMDLLPHDERQLVRALVVNKFRGDATLFEDGVRILEQRTGVPVAGVVPYLEVDLEDEDSMSWRLGAHGTPTAAGHAQAALDVAVLRLPRISNFTDFVALDACEGVSVRYVADAAGLGVPDLVVVPGTKSTLADLAWLRARGLDEALCGAASAGVPVVGICGGYQMLGTSVSDPHGMEGGGEQPGLGLLPVRTVFSPQKRTRRTEATFGEVGGPLGPLSGLVARGYEIHMGRTELMGGTPLLRTASGETDGCQRGNVYGCYLHGLFDEPDVLGALVSSLATARGQEGPAVRVRGMREHREAQFDALARGLRQSLDMGLVHRILEEGVGGWEA